MEKLHQKAAFIFRRDLRLEDNLGLLAALSKAIEVVPVFILDPRQIDATQNDYFSPAAFHFMVGALRELDTALQARGSQLYVCGGDPAEVVESLLTNDGVEAVFVNKDYTPFAHTRDKAIADVCEAHQVAFTRHEDVTLSPIESIRTGESKFYSVFTPFMKKAVTYAVPSPQKNNFSNYWTRSLNTDTVDLYSITTHPLPMQRLHGGRTEALKLLTADTYLSKYKQQRDLPAVHGTSQLSAHHKFGTLSIRETYHHAVAHAGAHSQFITELYWRDFYYYIAYHFPLIFKHSFLPFAQYLAWQNDEAQFKAWSDGRTGVPLVDAGMRQLNATGWMHNRVRMVVASFLVKDLHLPWQWGARHFMAHLMDGDLASNNHGWQWAAGTGTDAAPYFRVFNPTSQGERFDPDGEYVRHWIPELSGVGGRAAHAPGLLRPDGYPPPMVDHAAEREEALRRYRHVTAGSR